MPTAIIADDEELPRSDLRRMLAAVWPELRILAECEHGTDALEAIRLHQPDIAFLDIRMPGLSGLDVAHATAGSCHAVFTTAFNSHAFEAFDVGAIDYLLKPVTHERLTQTVQRLRDRLQTSTAAPDITSLMEALDRQLRTAKAEQSTRLRWISASAGETIKVFPIENVLFFKSEEKYTRVVTADDEAHVRKPLKELIDGLDPDEFWQVHRSILVRASSIVRAQRDTMGRVTVEIRDHDERLKVSQAYAWRFKPM